MAMNVSPTKKTTPPGSIFQSPPTPPRSDAKLSERLSRVLQALQSYKNGTLSGSPWKVFRLRGQEYDELLDRLKCDESLLGFVKDKVRYDYDPIREQFVLRMPTIVHDTFILQLNKEVHKKLRSLADAEPDSRVYIEKIESVGGQRELPILDNDGRNTKHVPDMMFMHKDAAWPGVVMEIAHSQKEKSLVNLAENIFLSKEATISIWRLKISVNDDGEEEGEVIQVIENQPFRDAQGNPVRHPQSGLELPLQDFVIQEVSDNVPKLSVVVDSETLCTLLGEAEDWDRRAIAAEGVKPRPFKRKWRHKTTPEELKSSEAERRIRKKTERSDGSDGKEAPVEDGSSQSSS